MSVNSTSADPTSVRRRAVRGRAAALGALALAGSLLATVPARADGTGGSPSAAPSAGSTPTGDGAQAVCKRLPKTEQRVTKALARLNGDASVAGSVARLQQRADNAKAAGHTEIEKLLNDRLTARKGLLTTLQTRQSDLGPVATWCAAHDQGKSR
ncbi:hypothetical protein PUR71_04420 [Streptomyces sp. SP17BM10]|uniref:hypothetical protein n=1 Tax=Streptomyces sp. SP17BM10 TaxID=3002530 RepID=UPI002E75D661|nr:hypothetical protein [Streptomyces sp. SP17BM10]MEE1782175.1 hypothetical protein [Streptomyces sp. SP17BM10]